MVLSQSSYYLISELFYPMNAIKTNVLLLLILFCAELYADQPVFRYLQGKDGLNDSEVNSIVQDKDGLMWFATYSGLISYDGYKFKHYRTELGNPDALPDKKIRKLFIDSEDNLWLATRKQLCRYIKASDSFITYDFMPVPHTGLFIINVSQIGQNVLVHVVDEYDHMQDGYYIIPLEHKNDAGYKWKRLDAYHDNSKVSDYFPYLTHMKDSILLMVSNDDIKQSSTIYAGTIVKKANDTIIGLDNNINIPAITNYIDYSKSDNRLYIGTNKGLYIYHLSRSQLSEKIFFANLNISHLFHASNNTVYCSSNSPGLYYVNLHTGKTGKYSSHPNQYGTLLNDRIHALYEDFSGNLWIGHQGQGISILNLHQKGFYTYRYNPLNKHSLKKNSVTSFASTDETVFIGLRPGGINYSDKAISTNKKQVFKEIKLVENGREKPFNDVVWDIEKENENVFWVASTAGLLRLFKDKEKWLLKKYSEEPIFNQLVRDIFVDDNNNIWFGVHAQGLILVPNPSQNKDKIYYQYKTEVSNPHTITDNTVLTMKVDSKGRFWVGTVNGLNLLVSDYQNLNLYTNAKPELKFKRYIAVTKNENFLNNNEINCLFENLNGNVWIGTQGGGINILNPVTDTFTHLTVNEGLPSNDVKGILADNMGKIWISTTKGLAVYNQHAHEPTFNYYDAHDGLQGNLFFMNAYYKAMDGEMFFGGDNGFTRFYPKEIKPNLIEPKIVFTDLNLLYHSTEIGDTVLGYQILKKHINETQKISLPYKHKTFSISAAAIHYQNPEGNKIMFKLEGFDSSWKTIPASYRNIYYSNLSFGKYLLKVKAVNSDNIVSGKPKLLTIEILKPWYFEWYTISVFTLLILSFIAGIVYIIFNRQKLIYEKEIDKLTIENTESKMTFLTNIAHGLKTPLSLVIAPIDDLVQNYSDVKQDWNSHLQFIQRNANYLLKLINQIIDFRKLNAGKLKFYPERTDIVKLVKDVALNFHSFENGKQIKLSLDIPYKSMIISIDAQKIEEVLYNLISNAFKHTLKNHRIDVSLRLMSGIETEIVECDFDFPFNDHKLKITVFNEGPTISESEKERIFDRFYKSNESIEGAGIGLSFSKSLVEMHGGNIEIETINDKGVAFHVFLPCTEPRQSEQINEYNNEFNNESLEKISIKSYEDIESSEKEKLKIVLVEDNLELRNFLTNILSKDYHCYEAGDGAEGLEIVKKVFPDIVISDIVMPEKDGYQLCEDIKSNSKLCHIPVILLSAKDNQDQIISGYDVGADAYVTKPFDLNIIRAQISRLIKNRALIRKKYSDQNFMLEVTSNEMTKDDEFILKFRNILESNISDTQFNVKQLGAMMEVSPAQLYRKIKALTGYSPVEFIRLLKLQKAYELILERKNTVKEVCYMSGFNNKSYFIKCFKEKFGITPASLKDSGVPIKEE